jgi:hypothetical protein
MSTLSNLYLVGRREASNQTSYSYNYQELLSLKENQRSRKNYGRLKPIEEVAFSFCVNGAGWK